MSADDLLFHSSSALCCFYEQSIYSHDGDQDVMNCAAEPLRAGGSRAGVDQVQIRL